ncbi:hypothetical protein BGW36DRAFT_189411 [Talaromyces proteolyticus]|uniref:RING-type domain-containing protein n=1 Tax=Talaromyces proteolyticus TaxID=1131652 RepID=A0AAD4KQ18_9EURO|nr:uncharacterized protein BGW36DRAFT_189411 [Talaromyces proteolyticus]KAH8696640.1 hypothetical protein BGW36DRAFT_189411 [Talaromyces proteolyticus]
MNPYHVRPNIDVVDLTADGPTNNNVFSSTDTVRGYQYTKEISFKTMIKDIFPDICETFLMLLYARYIDRISDEFSLLQIAHEAFDEILNMRPSYPKEVVKKRRRIGDNEENSDGEEEEDGLYIARSKRDGTYSLEAIRILAAEFPFLQFAVVRRQFVLHQSLEAAYQALHTINHSENPDPSIRLRRARPRHEINLPGPMRRELDRARKGIADKEAAKKVEEDERINEEKYRNAGTLIDCQCCFSEIAPNRSLPCENDNMHFFCFQCVITGAKTKVGQMKYDLHCFDVSGCKAGFNKKLLTMVIGDKLMKKLEYLQQRDEISQAHIEGLEECPFCDYIAICPSVDENKEFNCENPDCEKVSCRLCRHETHIPQTCDEAKKERGVPERRVVEEAMTQALIRTCPKCKVAIIKEDGCNKIQCRCGTLICDVCKEDITKVGYNHFAPHRGAKCPPNEIDYGHHRQRDEVKRAEKEAVDKILATNGEIKPEYLQIKNKDAAESLSRERPRAGRGVAYLGQPLRQHNVQDMRLPHVDWHPRPLPMMNQPARLPVEAYPLDRIAFAPHPLQPGPPQPLEEHPRLRFMRETMAARRQAAPSQTGNLQMGGLRENHAPVPDRFPVFPPFPPFPTDELRALMTQLEQQTDRLQRQRQQYELHQQEEQLYRQRTEM